MACAPRMCRDACGGGGETDDRENVPGIFLAAHLQPAILCIWQEYHRTSKKTTSQSGLKWELVPQ